MLVLKRKEGQWINITHRSGDVIRLRVYQICGGLSSHVSVALDDDAHNFEIQRPERVVRAQDRQKHSRPGSA
ncbi:MAG TPA: hypothetical protein VGZ22_11630 [Isosphaeraceae bacterium]|nr:hypothetical protein [Isosphaeraceae bacterium]